MVKRPSQKTHKFRNKLLLNQWLISQFGIDPFREYTLRGRSMRPFHMLAEPIKDSRMEGLDHDNLHRFYKNLINFELFPESVFSQSVNQLRQYEENIVSHTLKINEKRDRPISWKYFQWLTLLFTEIYLDKYFHDQQGLLDELNEFVQRFNQHHQEYRDISPYLFDDLNKLCYQCATGSGKTLLMHVNLLQYQHHAQQSGKDKELSRTILLTPNERLSEQHISEFYASGISADHYLKNRGGLFSQASGLEQVDVLEITKLTDQEGPNTIATRSLGDQNLLLVDEGHRGIRSTDEGVWFKRRAELCAKGFTFEYSATFEQAVSAAKNEEFEDSYAKTVLFDYSYRWFYEDGFGKDYHILNLPQSFDQLQRTYLTACLLKYYQQLCIYQDKHTELKPFNMEKPLWAFVGSTVVKASGSKAEKAVVSDVGQVIRFIADFLSNPDQSKSDIQDILTSNGQDTGLVDGDNVDIFYKAFEYLLDKLKGNTIDNLFTDILNKLFNSPAGGQLELHRIKGDSGEIVLKLGGAQEPFGLINVGDALGLSKHIQVVCTDINVDETDFSEAMFNTVKDSSSPVNLLIGSKKFIEGWDCWRVSTMGLMHVGKSEGTQIIQLFGRGVRLKGYEWSLKRSGHVLVAKKPLFIEELETLNVFGIEADFMAKFRDYLKEEGLPGNERKHIITVPLNVTYDLGKRLKILRPKRKRDGKEYNFKTDGPAPIVGQVPNYLVQNPIQSDWYPRIETIRSRGRIETAQKTKGELGPKQLALIDFNKLYFELEHFKRERTWYNINITKQDIQQLFSRRDWYQLYIPVSYLTPQNYNEVLLLQQIATELLKRYCEHYYNYCNDMFIKPRLEYRDLDFSDNLLPNEQEYQIITESDETRLIAQIEQLKTDIEANSDYFKKLDQAGQLKACRWNVHLYEPLFHVQKNGRITVLPVSLVESEYLFVQHLKEWSDNHQQYLQDEQLEIYLLRNQSRGKGIGFFEAGNFYPDFILWVLHNDQQYVNFIDPHGLGHEGPASPKIQFHSTIKEIESRLNDPNVILNSFILSITEHSRLQWEQSETELEERNLYFMQDAQYVQKMLDKIRA